jgi:polyisoprenoid-binding protein YceI/Flp pilus assembly protein TadD
VRTLNRAALAAACLALPPIAGAQAPRPSPPAALQAYSVDAGHTIAEFSIGFLYGRVKGRFTQTHGTILYDAADPARSSVTVVLESASIDTGWPHRDEHLKTSDFFDVERYPTLVFQSDRLRAAPGGWVADGTLAMHGVTRRVSIPFALPHPPLRSPESGSLILNATGTLRIARKDFGIEGGATFNPWFTRARAAAMSDSVDVSLEVEGWRADEATQRSPQIDAALERIRTDGVDASIARLRQALSTATSTDAGEAYFHGADLVVRALIADWRMGEAVALSRQVAGLFPRLAAARVLYGYALAVGGDARGAAREYAGALQLARPPANPAEKFPQVDERWYWLDLLARTAVDRGRPQAVALARTVAELYPATASAHTTWGHALAAAGDVRGAAAHYTRALALDRYQTRAMELGRRLPPST